MGSMSGNSPRESLGPGPTSSGIRKGVDSWLPTDPAPGMTRGKRLIILAYSSQRNIRKTYYVHPYASKADGQSSLDGVIEVARMP
jgi:hypothetical protein